MPLLESGKKLEAEIRRLLETSAPKVELVLDNAAAITTTAHGAIDRVETTLNDVLDRARLQVIRADDMVTRAMDQVEETTEKVAHTVTSPVKHASGIVHGISTGVGAFFGQKQPTEAGAVRRDVYLAGSQVEYQEAAFRRCLLFVQLRRVT